MHPDVKEEIGEFQGFQIVVKPSYSSTVSQFQLQQYLDMNERQKQTIQDTYRHKRLLGQHKTLRPMSAKTQIGGDAFSQVSLFKTQNQVY